MFKFTYPLQQPKRAMSAIQFSREVYQVLSSLTGCKGQRRKRQLLNLIKRFAQPLVKFTYNLYWLKNGNVSRQIQWRDLLSFKLRFTNPLHQSEKVVLAIKFNREVSLSLKLSLLTIYNCQREQHQLLNSTKLFIQCQDSLLTFCNSQKGQRQLLNSTEIPSQSQIRFTCQL